MSDETNTNFSFNQDVMTPKGKASFIGYFDNGKEAQVSMFIKRDGKNICVNPIFPIGDLTGFIQAEKRRPARSSKKRASVEESEGVSQERDTL